MGTFVTRLAVLALCVNLALGVSVASEEEFLEWQSISIQCVDTPEAGKVSIEASVSDGKYAKFAVHTFGKEHLLDKAQLAKLTAFPLSSLKTTHEAGYKELGGYTIHFRLERIRYDEAKRLLTERIYVSVNKNGVQVSDIRELKTQ